MMIKIKTIYTLVTVTLLLSLTVMGKSPRTARLESGFPPSLRVPYLYTEGIKASLMGADSTHIRTLFKYVISLDSTHAPSYYELADSYMFSNPRLAVIYSSKACAIDTTNIWYRSQLGRLMVITGKYDEAFDIYRSLTRLSPSNPENYRMLAALYEQRQQPFTAISLLDSVEYKLGRVEQLADMKRKLLIEAGLYDKALTESRAMIEEFPWDINNYNILAALYDHSGKDSLTVATYNQALSLDSTNVETLSALNAYYRKKNNMPGYFFTAHRLISSDNIELNKKLSYIAEMKSNRSFYTENFYQISALISTLLIKYPRNYDVIELYGNSLMAASGPEEGLVFFKSHLNDPETPLSIFNMVMEIETYLKRPDSLAKYSDMTVRRFSPSQELYAHHGAALAYMERYDEAMKYYDMSMKYAKTDSVRSVMHGLMGDIEHLRGNKKQSYKYNEQALREWADNALVLNNLSYYFSTDGPNGRDIPRAVELAERAIKLEPGNSTYLDTYAWALFKAGRFSEAKKAMQQAISLDSTDSSELYIHYGDILYELKEYFMASIYWKKALDKGYDADKIAERMKKIEGK